MTPEPKRLLILTCSQRKRPDPGLLPAIERYDGPQFGVLRKFLLEEPVKAQLLDTFILSANFGLISANQPISNYDYKMSPQRAQALQPKVTSALEQILQANPYSDLFISLGQSYWQALVGYERLVAGETQVTLAQGSQGGRQAALRRWLYNGLDVQHNAPSLVTQPGKARIRGKEITLTPEQVLDVARQALAEGCGDSTGYQSAYVLVEGQRVAPKWLVSQLTGLSVSSFHTGDARRVLKQLGIEVYSV
ncbi:MAG: hypothetical protein HC875_08940 [Anaerolineales bacterium]|nr:hypothetical protein [Anaerolineales bacterium]